MSTDNFISKIEGIEEIRRDLNKLADKQLKRIARNGVHEAARKIRDDAKSELASSTTTRTGDLIKSITAKRRRVKKWSVLSDVFPAMFYGRFVELGHEASGAFQYAPTDPAGRGFMRRAFEKNRTQSIKLVADRMKREVAKLKVGKK